MSLVNRLLEIMEVHMNRPIISPRSFTTPKIIRSNKGMNKWTDRDLKSEEEVFFGKILHLYIRAYMRGYDREEHTGHNFTERIKNRLFEDLEKVKLPKPPSDQ